MTEVTTITLDRELAVELAGWLGLLEDWLMHTDELVLDDLARFGFGHCYNPSLAVTDLIGDLGAYGVLLRRHPNQTTTMTSTPGDTPMIDYADTEHTSPRLTSPRAESGQCLCHDTTCCPDEATVTVSARDLAELTELLSDLDEFLRTWTGVAALMAEFIGPRRNAPAMNVGLLIDTVSFTAANLRRHTATLDPATEAGAQQ